MDVILTDKMFSNILFNLSRIYYLYYTYNFSSKNNYKLFPESTAYKKSWYSDSKQTIPVKSNEHANEISKFPFNL